VRAENLQVPICAYLRNLWSTFVYSMRHLSVIFNDLANRRGFPRFVTGFQVQ
jgi:hypothetical protein